MNGSDIRLRNRAALVFSLLLRSVSCVEYRLVAFSNLFHCGHLLKATWFFYLILYSELEYTDTTVISPIIPTVSNLLRLFDPCVYLLDCMTQKRRPRVIVTKQSSLSSVDGQCKSVVSASFSIWSLPVRVSLLLQHT